MTHPSPNSRDTNDEIRISAALLHATSKAARSSAASSTRQHRIADKQPLICVHHHFTAPTAPSSLTMRVRSRQHEREIVTTL